jgi:hypothetical protein
MADFKPPVNWRGFDGEDEMTDRDWHQRGHEQASCLIATGGIEFANPDKDGVPTGGCYNGDYTDEEHDRANSELDSLEGQSIIGGLIKFLFGSPKS